MKKIALILIILVVLLIPVSASSNSLPFSIEPGKVIGYNIKAGSKFTFPITIYNNSNSLKTFKISARIPDILSEGYEASDGKWVSIPGSIEVNPNSTKILNVLITAPDKNLETWIGIAEDKIGLRYELVTKVMINISKLGFSSLGIVKYSQSGEERHLLSFKVPIILGSATLLVLSVVIIVILLRKNSKKIQNL